MTTEHTIISAFFEELKGKAEPTIGIEHTTTTDARIYQGAAVKKNEFGELTTEASSGTPDKQLVDMRALQGLLANAIRSPEYMDQIAAQITKHDHGKSVIAKALELNLVGQFRELQKIRARIHAEIDEASREIRQDIDKLNACVEKTTALLNKTSAREAVETATKLADALAKLHDLHEKGVLEKMAAALMGIK